MGIMDNSLIWTLSLVLGLEGVLYYNVILNGIMDNSLIWTLSSGIGIRGVPLIAL